MFDILFLRIIFENKLSQHLVFENVKIVISFFNFLHSCFLKLEKYSILKVLKSEPKRKSENENSRQIVLQNQRMRTKERIPSNISPTKLYQ